MGSTALFTEQLLTLMGFSGVNIKTIVFLFGHTHYHLSTWSEQFQKNNLKRIGSKLFNPLCYYKHRGTKQVDCAKLVFLAAVTAANSSSFSLYVKLGVLAWAFLRRTPRKMIRKDTKLPSVLWPSGAISTLA
ncbi:hypothetical protein M0804_004810 [Polistes exclamans]|nr:hypothetical protein M0804_004810 [Polistes exclamans]